MYVIFTDTCANLPDELIERYGLQIIPLSYTVNGQTYPDPEGGDESFDGGAFYDAMRRGAAVTTSMVNTQAFTSAFSPYLSKGTDVIYIGISSGISGTHQAAVTAAAELAQQYPQRKIAVIDTRAASLGEGLPVVFAARLKEAGAPFEEVVSQTENNSEKICQYFTVEDLMYLKKGGRISGAAALVGNILQIKPILKGDEEGRIVLCHKERGRKRALEALVNAYRQLASNHAAPIGIAHADSGEGARLLADKVREAGHTGEILKVWYEPVTGSHVGPGTIALFFYGIHR